MALSVAEPVPSPKTAEQRERVYNTKEGRAVVLVLFWERKRNVLRARLGRRCLSSGRGPGRAEMDVSVLAASCLGSPAGGVGTEFVHEPTAKHW